MEAFSEGCAQSQEEATTDEEGDFRVRALKPGCTYRISVKVRQYSSGTNVQAEALTYPSLYEIDMVAEHVRKLQFVLTPIEDRTEVPVPLSRTLSGCWRSYMGGERRRASAFELPHSPSSERGPGGDTHCGISHNTLLLHQLVTGRQRIQGEYIANKQGADTCGTHLKCPVAELHS